MKTYGFIYFIGAKDEFGEKVKIGKTKNLPIRRLSSLQVGSPTPLILLGYFLTNDIDSREKLEHDKFKHNRIKGEWFRLPFSVGLQHNDFNPSSVVMSISNPDHMDICTYVSMEKNKVKKWYNERFGEKVDI